jgi:xanthine dehydrogenase small subunit
MNKPTRQIATHNIEFLLNGQQMTVAAARSDDTLLNWLRQDRKLTGSKEGCAEGDCGACTILLARAGPEGEITYQPVNGCILFLPMLDGCSLTTVEGVAGPEGALHPVQAALVENHASQCGFCTPGFVVSLLAGWQSGCGWSEQEIEDLLAGNLCRCTGYGPIVAAGKALAGQPRPKWETERLAAEADWLRSRVPAPLSYGQPAQPFYAPVDCAELSRLVLEHPTAQIIAGATDIGLWVTKKQQELPGFISVMQVAELQQITETEEHFEIAAAVSHAAASDRLAEHYPALGEIWRRFGSTQVRASGTVCGNIANGSPIGDLAPAFLALGAELVLQKGPQQRILPIEDFFLSYGVQDRQPGEWLRAVRLPKLRDGQVFQAMKISRRFDQDISAVMAAFFLQLQDRQIITARCGFGGMAGVPVRARQCEEALTGVVLADRPPAAALAGLAADFAPITDMRASADYRAAVAGNLLAKLFAGLASGVVMRLAGDGLDGLGLGREGAGR